MKILNFNSGFLPDRGGVATYSYELTKSLSENDQVEKVQVIAFNVSEAGEEKVNDKYHIIRIKRGTVGLWAMGFMILKYLWQYRDFDIIHATNMFPVGFWVMIWTKILRKKYFITIYGTDTLTKLGSKKTRLAKKIIMQQATKVFSFSNSTTQKTLEKYQISAKNFVTIYPGVTGNFNSKINFNLKNELGFTGDDFIVLTICHLVARKGVDDVIRAISMIEDERVKLIIGGQGPEKENLENLVKELKLEKRVKIVGLIRDVESYYRISNVFILASYYDNTGDIEGLGIVLIEAQLSNVPIIGTNSGGIPETMQNGVTGFVVPEHGIEEIKEKILFLKNNPDIYQKMSQTAKEFSIKNFNWVKVAKDYINFYQQN
ncbi:MAG TPA: glycosyltransferase family 4 protein [bacterium]|nr:glycosyltransferase family 4 protein [bacterium]